jgi:hypothetical protein
MSSANRTERRASACELHFIGRNTIGLTFVDEEGADERRRWITTRFKARRPGRKAG